MKKLVMWFSVGLILVGNVALGRDLSQSFALLLQALSAIYVGYTLGTTSTTQAHTRAARVSDYERNFMGGMRVGAEEALLAVEERGLEGPIVESVRSDVRREMRETDEVYERWRVSKLATGAKLGGSQ